MNESRVEGATHADRGGEDRAVADFKGGRDQQGRRVIALGDVLDESMQAFRLEDGRDAQPGVLNKRVLSKVDGPDCSVRQRPIFLQQVHQIKDSPSFSRVMKFGTPVQTCPPRLVMRKSSPVALNSMSAFE